jgi:hypothetical protein
VTAQVEGPHRFRRLGSSEPTSRHAGAKKIGAIGVALLGLAPSAGNIGSCGQEAVPLDAEKFYGAKVVIDCRQCTECGIRTAQCAFACRGEIPEDPSFPNGCLPLVHDGEVCLDALRAASCGAYESYVADQGATIPTECNFCPVDETGQPNTDEDP